MAINLISRQIKRRGLLSALPNPLEDYELGYAVDQQRLFIGKGSLADGAPSTGNLEILTQYSPNSTLLTRIYASNTGVSATTGTSPSSPIVRSFQSILDDRVSVKDYGAKGDGVTDDTDAINRALKNIYCDTYDSLASNKNAASRILFFPAGTYKLDGKIYIPTNAILVGEGIDRTIFQFTSNSDNYCVGTADSLFQTETNIGSNSATVPSNIYVENITFTRGSDLDLIRLHRSNKVYFNKCKFANTAGSQTTNALIYFDNLSGVATMTNYTFESCEFSKGVNAFKIDQNITFLNIVRGNFSQQTNAIVFASGLTNATKNIRILGNYFANITQTAIKVQGSTTKLVSDSNVFETVGDISNPNILFDTSTSYCSSTNDFFNLPVNTAAITKNSVTGLIINSETEMVMNEERKIFSKTLAILASQTNTTVDNTVSSNGANGVGLFVDYTLIRGSTRKIGTLQVISDGTTAQVTDTSTSVGATGFTMDATVSGGKIVIRYTTNAGSTGTLKYIIRYMNVL